MKLADTTLIYLNLTELLEFVFYGSAYVAVKLLKKEIISAMKQRENFQV